jgi:hypothetical protein
MLGSWIAGVHTRKEIVGVTLHAFEFFHLHGSLQGLPMIGKTRDFGQSVGKPQMLAVISKFHIFVKNVLTSL